MFPVVAVAGGLEHRLLAGAPLAERDITRCNRVGARRRCRAPNFVQAPHPCNGTVHGCLDRTLPHRPARWMDLCR